MPFAQNGGCEPVPEKLNLFSWRQILIYLGPGKVERGGRGIDHKMMGMMCEGL